MKNIYNSIKNFYYQYLNTHDRLIFGLCALTLLLAGVYTLINLLTLQYPGIFYLPSRWAALIIPIVAMTIAAMVIRKDSPRAAYVIGSCGTYFIIFVSLTLLSSGIQFTPFPRIDHYLVTTDNALGFNSLAVLNWTYAHAHIKHLFQFAYDSISLELFVLPIVLAFLLDREWLNRYFLTVIFSFLIGTTIYYFFPTGAPVSVFHSSHFTQDQHDTFLKFYQIHHYLKVTTDQGGMIAFPSFHVIWATLVTYAYRRRKYLFYPLALYNVIVIASTVFLGWHYLTDVIGGLMIAAISIKIASLIEQRYIHVSTSARSLRIRTTHATLQQECARVNT